MRLLFKVFFIFFIFLGTSSWGTTTSHIIFGPFVPGSGSWNTIYNGGFENGNNGWTNNIISRGEFYASNDVAYQGSYSAKAVPKYSFNGWGFAWVSNAFSVTPDTDYVLSGFFYTKDLTSGNFYLDLNDAWWENSVLSVIKSSGWQFGWVDVHVPSGVTKVQIRLVRDGDVKAGEFGYIDEVGFTPKDQFSPPTPVPLPSAFLLLGSGFSIMIFSRKRFIQL